MAGSGLPPRAAVGNFTSTHDRDKMDSHIENFFHRIEQGVFEALRGETAPLVLAGVEHETPMYRGINRYLHLAGRDVHGSPEGLKGAELHRRALDVAREAFAEPIQKALELFERLGGSERVASKPRDVLQAAAAGRVSHLFVLEGATHPGGWDKKTLKVKREGEGEDLLNIAALHTIVNGGDVWVTSARMCPAAVQWRRFCGSEVSVRCGHQAGTMPVPGQILRFGESGAFTFGSHCACSCLIFANSGLPARLCNSISSFEWS